METSIDREAFNKYVTLDPAQKPFTYPFTAEDSMGSKGQGVFQLGGDSADYTMHLDNISLVHDAD